MGTNTVIDNSTTASYSDQEQTGRPSTTVGGLQHVDASAVRTRLELQESQLLPSIVSTKQMASTLGMSKPRSPALEAKVVNPHRAMTTPCRLRLADSITPTPPDKQLHMSSTSMPLLRCRVTQLG